MNYEARIMNYGQKIKAFTDLNAWKLGHQLVLDVYEITQSFPHEELFGLCSQLRRAVVSFTSNIAGGFSRNSFKEKLQFYSIALGSLSEIQNQLLIAKDLGYMRDDKYLILAEQTVVLHKITNGLIKKSKTIIHDS